MGILILILTSHALSVIIINKYKRDVIDNANMKDYSINKHYLSSFINSYYYNTKLKFKHIVHIPIINSFSSLQILADFKKNTEFYDVEFEKVGIYIKKEVGRGKLIYHLNAILDDIDGNPTKEDLIFIKNFLSIIKTNYKPKKEDIEITKVENRVKDLNEEIKIKKKLR